MDLSRVRSRLSGIAGGARYDRVMSLPIPAPGTVNLHVANLDRVPSRDVLSADELLRGSRFKFAVDSQRFGAGRTFLRETLSRYLNVPSETIRFRYGPDRKPELAHPIAGLYFNLTHSRNLAILGVASVPVGVDVEHIDPITDIEGICRKMFSANEGKTVLAVDGAIRVHRFYRCWTLKEAVVKALGTGITGSTKNFDVSVTGEPRLNAFDDEPAPNWSLFTPHIADDVCAAVAIRHDEGNVVMTEPGANCLY